MRFSSNLVKSPPTISSPFKRASLDRKSTRLNSSHSQISYAVFCLKKKKNRKILRRRILHRHVHETPLLDGLRAGPASTDQTADGCRTPCVSQTVHGGRAHANTDV